MINCLFELIAASRSFDCDSTGFLVSSALNFAFSDCGECPSVCDWLKLHGCRTFISVFFSQPLIFIFASGTRGWHGKKATSVKLYDIVRMF